MNNKLIIQLKDNLRVIPNFPKKGIMFQDIFSLIENPVLLKKIISEITKVIKKEKITKIIGIDARGCIFGSIVSYNNIYLLFLWGKKASFQDMYTKRNIS